MFTVLSSLLLSNFIRCVGSLVARQTSWAEVPGFESGIYHHDPDALQDHCVILLKSQGRGGNLHLRQKTTTEEKCHDFVHTIPEPEESVF